MIFERVQVNYYHLSFVICLNAAYATSFDTWVTDYCIPKNIILLKQTKNGL